MNKILLQPTDVLFFRDGRPMSGAYVGHTMAWPLPDLTNHAFHAALHRAEISQAHQHRQVGPDSQRAPQRSRKFGCLTTAGPFPVCVAQENGEKWFFPRPGDTLVQEEPTEDGQKTRSLQVTLRPAGNASVNDQSQWQNSSLPPPLRYAVANTAPAAKTDDMFPWIDRGTFQAYLRQDQVPEAVLAQDEDIGDREAAVGIAIDPDTQTTGRGIAAGRIYTAHYLRLRDPWRLGVFAEALDKMDGTGERRDLIRELFKFGPHRIIVGGQQRVCTAVAAPWDGQRLPLPMGLQKAEEFRRLPNGRHAVKWVLLTPAIWPEIPEGRAPNGTERKRHPGGWLPNWVRPETGEVLLRVVPPQERRRRRSLDFQNKGFDGTENSVGIAARLVAALVPKPLVVTGWAIPSDDDPDRTGAKSTHLAVPAGAVYYFEAETAEDAVRLASALNWHGDGDGTALKNRRSTLLGEKGYGLGVCGTWRMYGTFRNVPEGGVQ